MNASPRMVSPKAAGLITEALRAIAEHCKAVETRLPVHTLDQAADIAVTRLAGLQREESIALWLDSQKRLIELETVAIGTHRKVLINVRDLVRSALANDARYVILAHNHPVSDAKPSEPDIAYTRGVETILAGLSVRLLDHLVVSYRGDCASIAGMGGLRNVPFPT